MAFAPPRFWPAPSAAPVEMMAASTTDVPSQPLTLPVDTPQKVYECRALGFRTSADASGKTLCVLEPTTAETEMPCPSGQQRNHLTGQCLSQDQFKALAEQYAECSQQSGAWDDRTSQCQPAPPSAPSEKDDKGASVKLVAAVGLAALAVGFLVVRDQREQQARQDRLRAYAPGT